MVNRWLWATAAASVVLLASGCASSATPQSTPSAAPTTTAAAPTQPASQAPTPTASPSAEAATCESLLDPATIEKNEADGAELTDQDEYAKKLTDEDNFLARFVTYGGIVCQMGIPNSDGVVLWAYGPITADQSAEVTDVLENDDEVEFETGPNENGGTYFSAGDDREIYVFSPAGYWAYSLDNGFPNVIEEVVKNAPAFY